MANTTWNPSDKAAGITLSGGNLTAKNTNNSICLGRAVHSQISGKFYWEYTFNTVTNISSGAGLAKSTITTAVNITSVSTGGPASGSCALGRGGAIAIDGGSGGVTFGTLGSGTVICIAVDLTAKLVWFRVGAAGNWNNNVANNPATGTGGRSIPNLGGSVDAFPAVNVDNTNDQITANFGDTAFTGTVPGGFASGFPTLPPVATTWPRRIQNVNRY